MIARHPWRVACAGGAIAGLLSLMLALAIGLSRSFSDPDESAHYVNALFLADWVRGGMAAPMTFARDYYLHFPKLSIGHWPPGWYALLFPIFVAVRPSPFAAHCISAVVAGLPAGLILWGGWRSNARGAAVAGAGAYLLLPLVIDGARHFLLDQPVTLVVGLTAIAWLRASDRPNWRNFLIFALLAAACPLVKGNGALIALVPAFHIATRGDWGLLRRPALWGAGCVALLVTAPWYVISFKLAAAGFNYAPGLDYAGLALASNVRAVGANIGVAGAALALVGAVSAWRGRDESPEHWSVAALALSVIVATFVFQSLVPAALEPRYVSPTLPWFVLLAVFGLVEAWRQSSRGVRLAALGCALIPVGASLLALRSTAPDPDIDTAPIVSALAARPGIWLVDGRSGGEGAVIAAAAYLDRGSDRIWIARASQWLSRSDFMGRNYTVTTRTPAEVRAVLDRLGVQGVISIRLAGHPAYPHSSILAAALTRGEFAVNNVALRRGAGHSLLAVREAAITPRPQVLKATVLAGSAAAF